MRSSFSRAIFSWWNAHAAPAPGCTPCPAAMSIPMRAFAVRSACWRELGRLSADQFFEDHAAIVREMTGALID
jgi:hypothetical protein